MSISLQLQHCQEQSENSKLTTSSLLELFTLLYKEFNSLETTITTIQSTTESYIETRLKTALSNLRTDLTAESVALRNTIATRPVVSNKQDKLTIRNGALDDIHRDLNARVTFAQFAERNDEIDKNIEEFRGEFYNLKEDLRELQTATNVLDVACGNDSLLRSWVSRSHCHVLYSGDNFSSALDSIRGVDHIMGFFSYDDGVIGWYSPGIIPTNDSWVEGDGMFIFHLRKGFSSRYLLRYRYGLIVDIGEFSFVVNSAFAVDRKGLVCMANRLQEAYDIPMTHSILELKSFVPKNICVVQWI
ncbi:hypothetical protein QTN25_006873 [Entamoeba marina]